MPIPAKTVQIAVAAVLLGALLALVIVYATTGDGKKRSPSPKSPAARVPLSPPLSPPAPLTAAPAPALEPVTVATAPSTVSLMGSGSTVAPYVASSGGIGAPVL